MSKASWAGVNPASGSGDVSVTVSAESANTGRNSRTTNLTITSNAGTNTVKVSQAGKAEFLDTIDSKSVDKGSSTYTLTGSSNSKLLQFTTSSGFITVASTYIAAGRATNNDGTTEIANDPGATVQYDFQITFTVAENTSESVRSGVISVKAGSLSPKNITITQAAGDPTLDVDVTELSLGAAEGSTGTFNIISNTSWSIS